MFLFYGITALAVVMIFGTGLLVGVRVSSWMIEVAADNDSRRRSHHNLAPRLTKGMLVFGALNAYIMYAGLAAVPIGVMSRLFQWDAAPDQLILIGFSEAVIIYLLAILLAQPLAVKTKI